jgi:CBS domain-containing protein
MICSEVMWADPPTLSPEESARTAVDRLIEHNVAALPVVEEDGTYLGLISERTLVRRVLGEDLDPALTLCSLIADRRTPSCDPEDPVAVALRRMDEGNYRWLPVVAGGKLVGMINSRDVRARAGRDDVDQMQSLSDAALRH